MNYKMTGRFIAQILLLEALFMIPAMFISLYCGENASVKAFLVTMVLLLVVSCLLRFLCRGAKSNFYATDGMVCVALSWIVLSLAGSLPFVLSGAIPKFIDALFEIVSGFTTTGASILPEVESLPKGIMYWRSFSHWVGGMGVLVFLLAIVPSTDRGKGFTMHLLRAESPGPSVGKLVPKMRKTAAILYILYIGLTIADIIFLVLGKMDVFEAVCNAFGTAGTGGFGVRNDSFASYSPYLQNVTTIFMFLFGVNFTCYYFLLLRQFGAVFRDEELRAYFGIVLGSTLLIAWNIRGQYATLEETFRHAAFQVSSITTTTGFATTDFDQWPSFSKTILLCLMVIGASAGSTGGGMKCSRILILGRSLRREIHRIVHPRSVEVVTLDGKVVEEETIHSALTFVGSYFLVILAGALIISLDNFSFSVSFSAALTCVSNVGPGLELIGPAGNFSIFSPLSKLVMSLCMIVGRLEILPVLVLFSRSTWRKG